MANGNVKRLTIQSKDTGRSVVLSKPSSFIIGRVNNQKAVRVWDENSPEHMPLGGSEDIYKGYLADSSSVSKYHAKITICPKGVTVIDLDSTVGTYYTKGREFYPTEGFSLLPGKHTIQFGQLPLEFIVD